MTPYEKETHIHWNDEEDFITVFTCHRRIITRMTKLKAKVVHKVIEKGKITGIEYTIPKNKVNLGINPKRTLSAEQKLKLSNQMRDNMQGKKVT